MHIAHVPKDVATQKLSPYLQTINNACYGWHIMKVKEVEMVKSLPLNVTIVCNKEFENGQEFDEGGKNT
jgi:hypothetical protein